MAVTISEEQVIKLLDGSELTIRPLKISLLRKFMSKFSTLSDVAEDNDKSMDLLLECVIIALQQFKPELAQDKEKLEELLDLPTVYKIIEEASGNTAFLPTNFK